MHRMYIKIAANSFRKYSFVMRSTFSDCYKVSQMTVFLYVTPYSLVKRTKHLHLNDGMNARNSFASLVHLFTYQITWRYLIKRRFFFNTHHEKLKFQFNFKLILRRLDFRIKKNSKIQIVHHTDLALARSITRYQLTYAVYRRYCSKDTKDIHMLCGQNAKF